MQKLTKLISDKKISLTVALTISLGIAILSLVRINNIPSISAENSDKIYHVIAYFTLSAAWNLFYLNSAKKNTKIKFILSICASIILFGIVIEVLQELITSYRTFDLKDMLANSIGCVTAAIVFAVLLEKLKIKWLKFN